MTVTPSSAAGIRYRHASHINLWMQSHCKLFSQAALRQIRELQFTDQHLCLGPLAPLDTCTRFCVSLSETNGVRWEALRNASHVADPCARENGPRQRYRSVKQVLRINPKVRPVTVNKADRV